MMRNILLILAMAVLAGHAGCGSGSGSGGGDGSASDTTAVTINLGSQDRAAGAAAEDIQRVSAIPSNIASVRVTVSAADMATVQKSVSVKGLSAVAITLNVPNGAGRLFVLEALDAAGMVLYRGESLIDLGGEAVTLTIGLLPLFCDLYVNNAGVDNSGCTDIDNPCKTISYALDQTSGNVNICVSPGTYNSSSGESAFPVNLKPGVGLKCSKINHSSIIDAGASPAVLGAANALIDGCTVLGDPAINDNGQVITVNDSIIDGSGTSGSGISLSANSRVTNSIIKNHANAGLGAGVAISGGSPFISGNTVTGNDNGIDISGGSPIINGNILSCNSGSSAGVDLRNSSTNVIDARNNMWDHPLPSVISYPSTCLSTGEDICYDDISGGVNSAGSTEAPAPCP